MSEGRIETVKGACVVALVRYLMDRFAVPMEDAFIRLLGTELYALLMDTETRLFMEPNSFLVRCCEMELVQGKAALYDLIAVD